MRVGELAARVGVSPDTVRYYERIGLLPPAPRADNGYRQYSDATVRRMQLIQNAVRFGFSLDDLRSFLRARESTTPPCQAVRSAAQRLLDDVERQIDDLVTTRTQMHETLKEWDARLASRPAGAPARLLENLPVGAAAGGRTRGLRRRRSLR